MLALITSSGEERGHVGQEKTVQLGHSGAFQTNSNIEAILLCSTEVLARPKER